MTTFEKVRGIISETINVSPDIVTETLSIGDIEQWDSMGNMAIIAALEEKLGIEFPIEDLFELNSVQSIVDEIKKMS